MTHFIFVTGGVVSSLGKGISAASVAAAGDDRGEYLATVGGADRRARHARRTPGATGALLARQAAGPGRPRDRRRGGAASCCCVRFHGREPAGYRG